MRMQATGAEPGRNAIEADEMACRILRFNSAVGYENEGVSFAHEEVENGQVDSGDLRRAAGPLWVTLRR